VALAQDGFAGANNPAQSAFAGNRYDVGVDLFMPDRSASFGGQPVKSGDTEFLIPEFGYNNTINDQMSFGLTVYGNGGMNTNYPVNNPNGISMFGGAGNLGIDLMQLIVAPTFAFKASKDHAFGVSPLFVYQKFKAQGLQQMENPGVNPGVNHGSDSSSGVGVRFGYLGNLNDQISLGASYSPKINMSRFDKYSWLFLEQGDFDIPENYSVGAAFKATPEVTVALDYQRINYNKVRSIGQPMTAGGFGWSNVDIYKLGIDWKMNQATTLRAGYSWGTNPVSAPNAQFNILAPGVIKDHLTLGATYALSAESEMSVAYMHGFKNAVSGTGQIQGQPADVNIKMKQNSLGIQYSRKF
jgi:long-chain fatty acid transport protein